MIAVCSGIWLLLLYLSNALRFLCSGFLKLNSPHSLFSYGISSGRAVISSRIGPNGPLLPPCAELIHVDTLSSLDRSFHLSLANCQYPKRGAPSGLIIALRVLTRIKNACRLVSDVVPV